MNDKPNSVINALKRLERAGAESSITTLKLREAVRDLAAAIATDLDSIAHDCPEGQYAWTLPRGYTLEPLRNGALLCAPTDGGTDRAELLNSTPIVVPPSRTAALQFAHDIATGWLDELAQWVEDRTEDAGEAADVLTAELVKRGAQCLS